MTSSEGASRGQVMREEAENAAAQWISRRGEPGWTTADAAALEAWLAESVAHRVAYYRLNAAWEEAGRLTAFTRHASPSPHTGHTVAITLNPSHRWPLATAAVIALMLLIGTLWIYSSELRHPNRYVTVVGGLEAVPLLDGSRITLNTDTEMRVALSAKAREVDLDRGEAFFEVAKDRARPFVVNAGDKRVVAVGTQFSVYREGEELRITVAEGTVRLENRTDGEHGAPDRFPAALSAAAGSSEAILLPAGSVARSEKDGTLVSKENASEIQRHLSWRKGLLTFRDTPLAAAVDEFNRYNSRQIVIGDPAIATLQLGGVFRATNIEPFIALLEQGFPVRAREEGDRIILTHN